MNPRLKQVGTIIAYVLIFAMIVLVTIVLVAYGEGYFYDRESGEIREGGLVLLDSSPRGANIYINGTFKGTTSDRFRLPAGQHEIDLHEEGYRTWSQEFMLDEGKVKNLQYPLLVPDTVSTTAIGDADSVRVAAQSPDQSYLALAQAAERDLVLLVDSDTPEEIRTVFQAPPEYEGSDIVTIKWAAQGSRMLVGMDVSGESDDEYFLVDPQLNRNTIQLSDEFEDPIDRVVFGSSSQELYAITAGELERINLITGQRTSLANDIVDMTLTEDGDLYAVRRRSSAMQVVYINEGVEVLRSYPGQDNFRLEAFEREGEIGLVLHNRTNRQVMILRELSADDLRTVTLPVATAAEISLNPSNRFVFMHAGRLGLSYDIERDEYFRFQLSSPLQSTPQWYNNHYLLSIIDGEVMLFDYDGSNIEYIAQAREGFAYGDQRNDIIYSLGQSDLIDEQQLRASQLE